MVFSLLLYQTTKLKMAKNTHETGAISIAMWMQRCNVGRIAQWSASVASCEATRCRHRASAHAVSPRRPPWLTMLKKKTLTKHNFYLAFARQTDEKTLNNFETHREPSTHVLITTSPDPNPCTSSQVEAISYILSYQT